MDTPGKRLREARKRAGFRSASAAAEAIGVPIATYNSHERAGDPGARAYKPEHARQYARRFGVTPEWLLLGTDQAGGLGGGDGAEQVVSGHPGTRRPGLTEIVHRGVEITPGGIVEAGAFRSVDEYNDDPPPPMLGLPDREFPNLKQYYYEVSGDSMNALKKRPILSGDIVVGIDYEAFQGRLPLRDGMIVVVEQTLNGGLLRELSIKQLEIYEDRYELHPRSTNAAHKPIIIKHNIEADDGRTVRILAVARRIINELDL
ncbi:hypothetical protein Maq22A_c04810 [Methylobacterium aquaticum]|uniref:HTH cro/C1-type domain-containing protein n=2 Tax=Methylobacterium aquaticum TaxID=270351 RepID=A0A0C6F7Q8_9HYPH|nr:hypothetical protein Maq22A_c04810 [Methylobacterium aquaticum]